ncbi:MAG: outer membrane protein OmpA-like peptidoglycan-associated protein/Flp pilus assembly protein TadD [Sphingobacteriales bacterium]
MIRLKHLGIIASFAILLSACAGLGRMGSRAHTIQYNVTPSPLALKGDQVPVEIKGKFPPKYFDKKTALEITPVLVYNNGSEKEFDKVAFQGEMFAGNNTVINYVNGGSFSYTGTIPFAPEMGQAELKIRIAGTRGSKTKVFPLISIANGVATTQQLISNDEKLILAEDGFQRITDHQQRAIINFSVNSSSVRSSELRDADVKEFKAFAKEVAANESAEISSVVIEAHASPEGEIRRNEKLAEQRANSAATKMVNKAFAAAKLKVAKDLYNFIPKGEDWLGFKELMQASNIKDKELIMRILGMYTDLNKREKEIRNLAATYTEISEKILPQLRRAQVTVSYKITGKSDEEISKLAIENSLELNVKELLYAATLVDNDVEKMSIYRKAELQFKADARASNNLGVLYYKSGDVAAARSQFEKSNSIQANSEAQNNLGVLARQAGNTAEAMDLYRKALSAGDDVKFNVGLAEIQNGEYSKAVGNLSGSQSSNEALAQLLAGNIDAAKTMLSSGSFDADANAMYILAVAEARSNNGEGAITALKKAITLDGALAAKAKKDVEFTKISFLPGFQSL